MSEVVLSDERKQALRVADCRAKIIALVAELIGIEPMKVVGFDMSIENGEELFSRLLLNGRYVAGYHDIRPFEVVLDCSWQVTDFTEIE